MNHRGRLNRDCPSPESKLSFRVAPGVRGNRFSIEAEAGDAVDVCAEGADVGGLEFLKDLLAWMTITITQAAGDDGPLR